MSDRFDVRVPADMTDAAFKRLFGEIIRGEHPVNDWLLGQKEYRALVRSSLQGYTATAPRCSVENAQVEAHQLCVYLMTKFMAFDRLTTKGCMVVHSPGAGKTLSTLLAILAAWHTDKRIYLLSSPGNVKDNDMGVFGGNACRFFANFRNYLPGIPEYPFRVQQEDRARASSSQWWQEESLVATAKRALNARLRMFQPPGYLSDKQTLTWRKASRYIKSTRDAPIHNALVIIDEVQLMFDTKGQDQPTVNACQHLRKFLNTKFRQGNNAYLLALSATPGNDEHEVLELLNVLRAPGPEVSMELVYNTAAVSEFVRRVSGTVLYAEATLSTSTFPARLIENVVAENVALYDRVRDLYVFRSVGRLFGQVDMTTRRRVPMLMNYLSQDKFRDVTGSQLMLRVGDGLLEALGVTWEELANSRFPNFAAYERRPGYRYLIGDKVMKLMRLVSTIPGKHLVYVPSAGVARVLAEYLSAEMGLPQVLHKFKPDAIGADGPVMMVKDVPMATNATLTAREFATLWKMWNADDNADGSRIKLMVCSGEQFKGVNHRHLAANHVVCPLRTKLHDAQLIGRGPRFCSHAVGAKSNKAVKNETRILYYYCRVRAPRINWDLSIEYDKTHFFDGYNRLMRLMSRAAVDCSVFEANLHRTTGIKCLACAT